MATVLLADIDNVARTAVVLGCWVMLPQKSAGLGLVFSAIVYSWALAQLDAKPSVWLRTPCATALTSLCQLRVAPHGRDRSISETTRNAFACSRRYHDGKRLDEEFKAYS